MCGLDDREIRNPNGAATLHVAILRGRFSRVAVQAKKV